MEITPELIQLVIYVIIIAAIIIFIVKKAIIIAITLGVILLLFNVGFRFDGTDMMDKLKINEYLEEDTASKVSSFFDDFASKREEYGIVDADKVYEGMTDTIEKGYHIVVEGIGKIDIDKFAKNLASNIYEAGLKDIDFNQLVKEIQEQLNISEEEATKIGLEVKNQYQSIKDGK